MRVIRRRVAWRSVAVLISLCPLGLAQDSGLLLGHRTHDSDYQTLWIYSSGDTVDEVRIPHLLVPRPSGFWRVGVHASLYTAEAEYLDDRMETGEEHLWALPVGQRPTIALKSGEELVAADRDANCFRTSRQIHFVTPSYLWHDVNWSQECIHVRGESESRVVSHDQLDGPSTPIDELLGDAGYAAFRKGFMAAYRERLAWEAKNPANECGQTPEVDKRSWKVHRREGRWVAESWAKTHRVCGYGFEFDIPISLPESLTGHDRLPGAWEELAASIPELWDAFSSPSNNLLIALTAKHLLVYRPLGSDLGAPVLRRSLDELDIQKSTYTPPIVMARWAVGRHVPRWTDEVRKRTKRVEPRVHRLPASER